MNKEDNTSLIQEMQADKQDVNQDSEPDPVYLPKDQSSNIRKAANPPPKINKKVKKSETNDKL